MENDKEYIPRKKDFKSRNFQPIKKRRLNEDFEKNNDESGPRLENILENGKINETQIKEEEIPELTFENFPIEAALHSEPPDMMDILLQADVHREPENIPMPSSMPLLKKFKKNIRRLISLNVNVLELYHQI